MLHLALLKRPGLRRALAFLSVFTLLLVNRPISVCAAPNTGVVTGDVILRTKASTSSVPLATIGADQAITLLDRQGDWYKVKTGSLIGYVMAKYVHEEEPAPTSQGESGADEASSGAKLMRGAEGGGVLELQKSLKMLGFFSGEATGTFGSATEAAVKAYQQARGLAADGIAGAGTLARIDQETREMSGGGPTSPTTSSAVLKKGDQGDGVIQMQQALKDKGFFTGEVTGYFGAITETALMAYQQAVGLTADGVAGATTLNKLLAGDSGSSAGGSTVLRMGDSGSAVANLQNMLKSAGFYTGGVDGNFGEGTQKALVAFQTAAGLSADGVAGTQTLDKLAAMINNNASVGQGSGSEPLGGGGSTENTSGGGSTVTPPSSVTPSQSNGSLKLVDWWSGEIDAVYPRQAIAQLTDIRTGITLNIYRYGGTNHLDFEPATLADTELFLSLSGGVGSWNARPAILTVNGTRYACAMNTMGHGGEHLADNGFEGQCCLHFLNSYTHGGKQVNADMQTQIMVAFNSGK